MVILRGKADVRDNGRAGQRIVHIIVRAHGSDDKRRTIKGLHREGLLRRNLIVLRQDRHKRILIERHPLQRAKLFMGQKAQIRNILLDPFYDLISSALHQLDTDARVGLLKLVKDRRKPTDGNTLKGGDGQGTGFHTVNLIDSLLKGFIHGQNRPNQRQDFLGILGQLYTLVRADEKRKSHFLLQRFQNMADPRLSIAQTVTALGKITGLRHIGKEFEFFYIHRNLLSVQFCCEEATRISDSHLISSDFFTLTSILQASCTGKNKPMKSHWREWAQGDTESSLSYIIENSSQRKNNTEKQYKRKPYR